MLRAAAVGNKLVVVPSPPAPADKGPLRASCVICGLSASACLLPPAGITHTAGSGDL